MASGSKGVRAGRAFVELFADDTALARGLKRAQKRLSAFGQGARALGTKIAAAGTAALAGFGAATGVFARVGDALDKMSLRTGLSVETLSELRYAAEQTGADMETLEKGVRTMQKSVNDLSRGLSTQTEAFDDLGLSISDLQGRSPEEQFKLIADRISGIEDPSKRAALAMQILGRAGTQLLPLMQNGAAGIEALQDEARAMGLTISTQTAKDAARLTDAMNTLRSVLRVTAVTIGAAIAPAVERATKAITRIVVGVHAWIKENRALVVLAAKVALGVTLVGGALIAIGTAAAVAAFALGGIVSVIGLVGSVLGGLAAVLGAVLSPIGLVVAALAAAVVAFFRFTAAGQQAIGFLQDKFAGLSGAVTDTLGAVRDALAAGDIGLAAKVLWAGLKVIWLDGTEEIRDTFAGGVVAMRRLLLSVVSGMQRIWINFTGGFRKAWEATQNWLSQRFLELQGLFDSSLDVEAGKKNLEEQSQAKLRSISQKAEDALNALDREQSAKEQDILDDALGNMDKRRQALIDAKKDLDRAVSDAKQRRADADAGAKGAGDRFNLPTLPDDLAGAGDRIAKARVQSRGTFNAAAVQGLQSDSLTAERTAKAVEETARLTRRLVERSLAGGVTFT